MNDPRITQYALGELTGTERERFERDLAGSETLQRELHETLQLAETLGSLPMPTDTLTTDQKSKLHRESRSNLREAHRKTKILRWVAAGAVTAAAACVLISLSLPALTGSLPRKAAPERRLGEPAGARETAMRDRTLVAQADNRDPAEQKAGEADGQTARAEATPGAAATPSDSDLLASSKVKTPLFGEEGSLIASGSGPSRSVDSLSLTTAPAAPMSGTIHYGAEMSRTEADGGRARGAQPRTFSDSDIPVVERLSRQAGQPFNTEAYDSITENVFLSAVENPLSTFSIDVDTASYSNVRRFLQSGQLPPVGAVRTEELINYFSYDDPQPKGDAPLSVNLEVGKSPWDPSRNLVRVGLKARETDHDQRAAANLVFLVDVSGSMNTPDKLPLLKKSLRALVENLAPKDHVAIVVYAGSSGLVLPPTPGTDKPRILEALDNLEAGGSTNGGAGIRLAYKTARENFLKEGANRVILCTDGDFNVGTTNQSELVRLIEQERESGVFLSVLGFGTGNLKDSTMEKLADKGNGNYAYIDSLTEGRKVLVEQMGSTLFTLAKDVKVQVEFNPARVAAYRLVGYENRLLAKEDFNDDKKDAGEMGAGHTVTALYEIIPAGQPLPGKPSVDPLKYQTPAPVAGEHPASKELLTVKVRYKEPDGDTSKLLEFPLAAPEIPAFDQTSPDFQFSAAVAAFGMKLRGSPDAGDIGWSDLQKIVRRNLGEDPGSYRAEFLTLIEKASALQTASEQED